MNRLLTHAIAFGFAISEASGNSFLPIHSGLSLTITANGGKVGPNPGDILFEYMKQCADANLDKENCLVRKTIDAFGTSEPSMDGDNDGADLPLRRRFLQPSSDNDLSECSAPNIGEKDLRFILSGSKQQCTDSGHSISDSEFETAVAEFLKVFGNQQCWTDLCDESNQLLHEVYFDVVSQCAEVDFTVHQCVIDHAIELIFQSESHADDINGPAGSRLRRVLQQASCEKPPSDMELSFMAAYLMAEAEIKCLESEVALEPSEKDKAMSDFMKLIGSHHCWSVEKCDVNVNDDQMTNDDDEGAITTKEGGFNPAHIALQYISQCAGLNLNADSCVVSNALDIFMNPSGPNGRRFLQDNECSAPDVEDEILFFILNTSKQQCIESGIIVSDEEFVTIIDEFSKFFGANGCWVSFCEEASSPSDVLLKIIFDEAAKCAQIEFDFNPCIMNYLFETILSLPNSDDYTNDTHQGRARRVLQQVTSGEECQPPPSQIELDFLISMMLTGAEEKCTEMAQVLVDGEIDKAKSRLARLFGAQHCFGAGKCGESGSSHDQNEINSLFVEFVESSAVGFLIHCGDVQDVSCVFSSSIYHLLKNSTAGICKAPTVDEHYIYQTTLLSEQYCVEIGHQLEQHHFQDAQSALKNIVANPQCWEDMCTQDAKDALLEGWMHTCASIDMNFLLADGYTLGHLKNDKLRCMAGYILSKNFGSNVSWECGISNLGSGVCDFDIGQKSYLYCSDEVAGPPSPSPNSMSFDYGEYDWADFYKQDMSLSFPYGQLDDGFSMGYGNDDSGNDEMNRYIDEVCTLVEELSSAIGAKCLRPVCEIGIEGALAFNETTSTTNGTEDIFVLTSEPTASPSKMPSLGLAPTSSPTSRIPLPTVKPTPLPTKKPTSSPTKKGIGSIEVTFEMAVTLEGIDMSDLDITALDSIVDLLEKVFVSMLPEGARIRLLRVGGFAVTRRLLRYLEGDDASGVDIEFEVKMTKECESAGCENSEAISSSLYNEVTSDFKAKVEDGSLSTAIQEEADAEGVSELRNVTIKASSFKASAAKITVNKGDGLDLKTNAPTPKDDDSASTMRRCEAILFAVVLASVVSFLQF